MSHRLSVHSLHGLFILGIGALALALVFAATLSMGGRSPVAQAALGGPVIIGGDDMTDHGTVDVSGNPIEGWLYIQRALENISSSVSRTNDGSVAAIGTAGPSDGDAGAAIAAAASHAGLTVTYHEGPTAISQFFTDLGTGTVKPKIIWIAGTDASGDLDSAEVTELDTHGPDIAAFVNSGGGLLSHGVAYGWLFSLLPGATSVDSGGSDDLYFTPDGTAALPGLTESDINAGPWHNHFEGDFGGLKVLVRSRDVLDSQDNDAAVIIGGAQVVLPGAPEPTATTKVPVATPCIAGIVESRCFNTQPLVTPTAPAPTAVPPTVAPASPTPVTTVLGAAATPRTGVVVAAPNTGTGGSTGSGQPALWLMLAAAAVLLAGAGAAAAGVRRR